MNFTDHLFNLYVRPTDEIWLFRFHYSLSTFIQYKIRWSQLSQKTTKSEDLTKKYLGLCVFFSKKKDSFALLRESMNDNIYELDEIWLHHFLCTNYFWLE